MEDSNVIKEYNLNLCLAENRKGMSALYDELSKGDIIKFGRYPQKESEIQDIEWYVLHKENGQVLLQSKNILDFCCPEVIGCDWGAFSEGWANNPLRFWLNTEFLSNAFSDNEKSLIRTTHVHADPKTRLDRDKTYHIDKKSMVSDEVFVLSSYENEEYFPETLSEHECPSTEYAWVRSDDSYFLHCPAYREECGQRGIRPAIRLALKENDITKEEITSALLTAKRGDVVKFGRLYQREYPWEEEWIEWIVLSGGDKGKLLLTKTCLDYRVIGGESWDKSQLRKWLNNDFLHQVFSGEEQKKIMQTELRFKSYIEYDKPRSLPTVDKVFLLGINEAEKYIPIISDFGDHYWWLRDDCGKLDLEGRFAMGHEDTITCNWGSYENGVRPAIWVAI